MKNFIWVCAFTAAASLTAFYTDLISAGDFTFGVFAGGLALIFKDQIFKLVIFGREIDG